VWRVLAAALVVLLGDVATAQPPVNPGFIRKTVDSLGAVIAREHFDSNTGSRVETILRERADAGHYDRETTLDGIAKVITRDLVELTGDKHLALMVSLGTKAPERPGPSARPRCSNPCGFTPVEILPGNIGYVNVAFFFRPEEARASVAEAMATVRDAAALIFDMRQNGGGSPGTVALLASYLFEQSGLPLFEIVERSGRVARYVTEPTVLRESNGARPVYVLTSRQTFSGGEGFAFLLQELGRAVIIGEGTAGAANAAGRYRVNEYFEAQVSSSTVRTVKSGRNWEGSGVQPDVAAAASDALRIALARAR
jgi:hypothetical protein